MTAAASTVSNLTPSTARTPGAGYPLETHGQPVPDSPQSENTPAPENVTRLGTERMKIPPKNPATPAPVCLPMQGEDSDTREWLAGNAPLIRPCATSSPPGRGHRENHDRHV